jgi:hypothetical protein
MRNGVLGPADLPPELAQSEPKLRYFGAAQVNARPEQLPSGRIRQPIPLCAELWGGARNFLLGGTAILAAFLLTDLGVAKYQEAKVRDRGARLAQLAETALSRLQAEVQSVTDRGGGRYELAVVLWNSGEAPTYVMSPDMHGYVQVGNAWQEVPLEPADGGAGGVLRIDGKRTYRYSFDCRVKDFTQLLPNYMHVRFSQTMLVSQSSARKVTCSSARTIFMFT